MCIVLSPCGDFLCTVNIKGSEKNCFKEACLPWFVSHALKAFGLQEMPIEAACHSRWTQLCGVELEVCVTLCSESYCMLQSVIS